ncbi:CAP2 protein, partial [Polyodon spathula]|nr:CAP2 protein [Polyodon spathula]
ADLATLLRPISVKIQEIQNFREKNRGSKMFNHLSAVSESIPALGWIAVAPKPGPYVKEMNDAATFYTNRVLKEYKDNDKRHVDWVRSYLQIWTELQAYIKEHHTTGLVWSKSPGGRQFKSRLFHFRPWTGVPKEQLTIGQVPPRVGELRSARVYWAHHAPATPVDWLGACMPALSLVAPPADGPCPPPPPPPGPPPIFDADPPKNSSSTMHSALFAELNQGEAITRGKDGKYWLRHVLDGQKTHKNPELRSQGGVARQSPTKSHTPSPTSPKAPPQNHFPVLELEGKKWRVEYQDHANSLVISETELKHVVYAFKCSNSTLQIKGKINSIIVVVMGKVPTISVNKTEGCHIYLSEESLHCEIKEFPVPEQYKTVWDGSKLVTEPTEMAG